MGGASLLENWILEGDEQGKKNNQEYKVWSKL